METLYLEGAGHGVTGQGRTRQYKATKDPFLKPVSYLVTEKDTGS